MLNYIKYEWLRRWKLFLAGIIVFLIVNVDMMGRLINKVAPNFISAFLIALLFTLCGALVVDHMGRLYRTLFTDEGFTDLTLPLSGYKLLGAKLLAVFLESAAIMSIVGIVAYIDFKYVQAIIPHWILTSLTWENFLQILQVSALVLGGYITFLLMVYLSLALSKSLFASFKHGRLIAFGCFLLLGKVIDLFGRLFNFDNGYCTRGAGIMVSSADWLGVAMLIGILFIGTAYLLDRKINL